MHWRMKGLIQKTLGVMPGGEALHYHLQRRFGGLQDFHRELSVKVEDWQIGIRRFRSPCTWPVRAASPLTISTAICRTTWCVRR